MDPALALTQTELKYGTTPTTPTTSSTPKTPTTPNVYVETPPVTTPVVTEPVVTVPDTSGNTMTTTTTPGLSLAEYLDMVNKMYEAAENSTTKRLQATLQASIGNLEGTIPGILQTYKGKKNEAAAQSDIGALNFAQYMAARGIKGSAGGMPEIYRNAALQNALNRLDTAQSQDIADIQRQIATLRNTSASELDAALADIAMARAQAELDARKYVDAQSLQLQEIAKRDEDREYGRRLAVAEMTGNYSGMSKWWQQEEIAAAEKQWQTNNTPRVSYSGGGGGGSSSKKQPDTSSIVQTMLSLGNDVRAYDYLLSLGLPQGTAQAAWEFYQKQKSTGGFSANYSAIYKQAGQMIANGASMDEVKDYIVGKVAAGGITTEEAKQIAAYLGIQ